MSKQTIKFQPIHPEEPSRSKALAKSKGFKKPTADLPLKIFLNNLPIGFIKVKPFTIFIKGLQLPGKFQTVGSAKACAINHIAQHLK